MSKCYFYDRFFKNAPKPAQRHHNLRSPHRKRQTSTSPAERRWRLLRQCKRREEQKKKTRSSSSSSTTLAFDLFSVFVSFASVDDETLVRADGDGAVAPPPPSRRAPPPRIRSAGGRTPARPTSPLALGPSGSNPQPTSPRARGWRRWWGGARRSGRLRSRSRLPAASVDSRRARRRSRALRALSFSFSRRVRRGRAVAVRRGGPILAIGNIFVDRSSPSTR